MPSQLCESENHNLCHDEDCDCSLDRCHLTCPTCSRQCKRLFGEDQRCASCERDLAKKTHFSGYPCDDCGFLGAFRNPIGRKNIYRCTSCHVKAGSEVKLPGSVGQMVTSACAHKELTDPAHEFLKLKQSRYRCRRCHQDAFTGTAGIPINKLNVVGETKQRA